MTGPFPKTMDFSGHNEVSRIECDIFDLVIEGTLPADLNGHWYRAIPDPQYPPLLGDDTNLSGDGMVSLFRFENGHVDYKVRYVQTERLKNDRAARRSLHGLYRNPYTDDPSVRGKGRGAANTTPIYHGGRLFALKEDSRAWELNPHTLETVGEWSYGGRLRSQTMTAHPRFDPETGEMCFFGYEASGLASRDVAYCVADKHGNLVREDWFQVPFCALMHDFAVTKEHVVFPGFPITANLDRIKAGGPHWAWEPARGTFMGVMPRDGRVDQMRWFRAPACSAFHFLNAFSEGQRVHVDFSVSNVPAFAFMREAGGLFIRPDQMSGNLVRWTFNLARPGDEPEQQHVLGPAGDLPRVADKDAMRDYGVAYYNRFDPSIGPPILSGPVGVGFNAVSRLELGSGKLTTLAMDPQWTVQEAVHIASAAAGHEGYLAFVVDRHDQNLAEVFVVEAARLERGPVSRIKMPLRLRSAVHGSWVPLAALGA